MTAPAMTTPAMTSTERTAWIMALIGLIGSAVGWIIDPRGFYGAWLSALVVVGGWPLGSMALLLIHALTGGRWGEPILPALRLAVRSLPVLLPAAVPIVFGLFVLYPWAGAAGAGLGNRFYLNLPFFGIRSAIYVVAWFGLGILVLRGRRLDAIAPFGLMLLALTLTFAAVDSTLSLDPHMSSSVYGMIAGAGVTLLALSVAVLLTATDMQAGARGDLGRLLLALTVLWIYLDFMQLLIVWQSDLAHEAGWYVARSRGFWGWVRGLVAIGHFLLPFFLLLSPRMQRRPMVVRGVAALLIAMAVMRGWWTVLPSLARWIGWIDLCAMLGLGGLALAVAMALTRWSSDRCLATRSPSTRTMRHV